jgi:hypothetical protein
MAAAFFFRYSSVFRWFLWISRFLKRANLISGHYPGIRRQGMATAQHPKQIQWIVQVKNFGGTIGVGNIENTK